MKLGKKKKNTPGCLTNKAMAYIKNKPAMYGKPAKFEDQKGTSEGITQEDVIKARTEGYNPKMYGKPKAYGKPAPECKGLKGTAFRDCQIKAYNKKFGKGAYQEYVAKKNTKN